MAATRLMPLHSGKGQTVAEALSRVTDYVKNPEKTNGGDLVTAYQCNPTSPITQGRVFFFIQPKIGRLLVGSDIKGTDDNLLPGRGGAVLGAADPGEAAGDGIQRGLQHRQGVCEQPEDGLE